VVEQFAALATGMTAATAAFATVIPGYAQDASLMVLVWQVGTVFILTATAAWAGHYLLNWGSIIGIARSSVLTRESKQARQGAPS